MQIGGVRIEDWLAARPARPERLPLRWAIPAICLLAAAGWAAIVIPLFLLLR